MQQDDRGGLIIWIQNQPGPARVLIFCVFVTGVVLTMFSATAFLFWLNLRGLPRVDPVALPDTGIRIRELVRFEDEKAYPGALAAYADTFYVGSYATGAIWRVDAEGNAHEIPQTRDQIGSVAGLDVDRDGALYVLDRLDPLLGGGATIWRIQDETLEEILQLPANGENGIAIPNDLAVDADHNLYLVDAQLKRVLRLVPGRANAEIWWEASISTVAAVPAGLAVHPQNQSLLITDTGRQWIYEVPLDSADPGAESQILYQDRAERNLPGFNGITVAPDGMIYVAALSLNEVGQLDPDTNQITYLAGAFRGSSDVAYDTVNQRVLVNNWDQRWLLPVKFVFLSFQIEPHLPFSVDVIEFEN